MDAPHAYRHRLRMFDSPHALARWLADRVASAVEDHLQKCPQALLTVSGGNTPQLFLRELSQADVMLDTRLRVTLADERWVPESHPRSNAAMVRRCLLRDRSAPSCFVPLYREGTPMTATVDALNREFGRLSDARAVAVLGMGNDGHTASLFPDDPQLPHGLTRNVCLIEAFPPSQPEPRVSWTLNGLLGHGEIFVHIEGEEKRRTLERVLEGDDPAVMPIRAILSNKRTPVTVCWSPTS